MFLSFLALLNTRGKLSHVSATTQEACISTTTAPIHPACATTHPSTTLASPNRSRMIEAQPEANSERCRQKIEVPGNPDGPEKAVLAWGNIETCLKESPCHFATELRSITVKVVFVHVVANMEMFDRRLLFP